ncbi:MAG: DNA polymerase I [Patescibacteria group bacterium]
MSAVKPTGKKLAIIDGKSVFYRGYYAMPNLSTKDGTPTGGVFGFTTMALEVIRRLKPDYVCVAWDKPKTNIRKRLEMYPAYKAGRKPAPPDFYEQIPVLHEVLEAFGWPLYELDDYEADDIMGTLAAQAAKQGIETQLVTSDLDMLQLIDPLIHVYALKKGLSNIELFRPETFIMKYGIKPEQFLDLKALKGDSSDNIPGVPGIGEKGAIELLKAHQTLDGVYENLDLIKDSAILSKKIAAIWTDAPIKLDLNEVDGSKCDPEKLLSVLQRLEFLSLARQLPDIMKVKPTETSQHSTPNLFDTSSSPKVNIISSPEQLAKIRFNSEPAILFGRSTGKHGKDPKYLVISQSPSNTCMLDIQKLLKGINIINFDLPINVIGYDIKNTLKILIELELSLPDVKHDILIGAFLLNSLRREQSLTELAQVDLGYDGSELEDLTDEDFIARAPEMAAIIRGLYQQQVKDLAEVPKVQKLAEDIEWPVIPVLAAMEHEGIRLDVGYLEVMNEQLTDQISDIEQQIYGHADSEFNISSPGQLAEVLFTKLQLPTQGVKKGKTGYSTAATELDKLRGQHPIIDLITQYREYTKLKNTYVDTLPQQVDEESRLHTTYALTVAQTGRLSSNDPNLQNIPVRTDLGRQIRTAFVARPGHVLISADYSQFELRLAAYLAGDKELIDMFNAGADIHTMTAAQVYGREPEDVTKQMRRDAKVINFGVLYGMSPHGLSVATGMTIAAAKTFIDKYFELRKPILEYMNRLKESARKDGYVETLFGRRRPTPDVHSTNFIVRSAAERAALNMPIQGTEADLMKMAMIEVQRKLDQWRAPSSELSEDTRPKLLLQVHDSLIVESMEDDAEKVAEMLKDTMEHVYELPVKLDVDVSTGKNWGEL